MNPKSQTWAEYYHFCNVCLLGLTLNCVHAMFLLLELDNIHFKKHEYRAVTEMVLYLVSL